MSKAKKYYHPDSDFYSKHNIAPPEAIAHGTEDELEFVQLKPNSWRLEGNKLIGDTEMGELVNLIPPNYILTGTDDEGTPIFKKLDM
jgi:hypothetical protein